MTINEILQTPHWVIDILPKQVPANSPGQFFTVENSFREEERMTKIKYKHINFVMKLNCYMDIAIDDEETINPPPSRIAQEMRRRYVWIRIGDAMIISEPDDTHMTLFNPDEELLELAKAIAPSEGLFVWQPEEGND